MRLPGLAKRFSHSRTKSDTSLPTPSSEDSLPTPDDNFSRIFDDAALYSQAIEEHDDDASFKERGGAGVGRILNDAQSLRSFITLVGADLEGPEKEATERYARLRAGQWGNSDAHSVFIHNDSDSDDLSLDPSEESIIDTPTDVRSESPKPILEPRTESQDFLPEDKEVLESWKRSPEEIVDILIAEFGPLADPGEEKLLLESDGSYFEDVAILGAIHVTTHRFAFNASLLSTRPDLAGGNQPIKAGPATLPRRKNKRVWLEVCEDMLVTYPSSRVEDRIRPYGAILFSAMKEVLPADPKHPTHLRSVIDFLAGTKVGVLAFDTPESAQEWKREIEGALFVWKRRRNKSFGDKEAGTDDEDGVRMSIPFNLITRHALLNVEPFAHVLRITALSKGSFSSEDSIPSSEYGPTEVTLNFAIMQKNSMWLELEAYVEKARAQELTKPSRTTNTLVVDFGPMNFLQRQITPPPADDHVGKKNKKEKAIRNELAIEADAEAWITRARLRMNLVSSGYLVLTDKILGFWSKSFGHKDVKYRFPISLVTAVGPYSCPIRGHISAQIELEGQPSLIFHFGSKSIKEEAVRRITDAIAALRAHSLPLTHSPEPISPGPTSPGAASSTSSKRSSTLLAPVSRTLTFAASNQIPAMLRDRPDLKRKVLNLPQQALARYPSIHFVCLTIGSRGDVQPYIALGMKLLAEGHSITIVTHEEYKEWVEGFGIRHRTAGGDPGALMKLSVENKMFSPQFFKESLGQFRGWLDQLLIDSWEQCKDAGVLLESPSAMAGVHIAEALGIPYFRTFTMPWTKTNQFPHAFLSPPVDSPTFNSASYVLFDNVFWAATSGQINRWRQNTLHISPTDMNHLAQSRIPFIYNFSPAVVPKPLDWNDAIIISGYWFLDNSEKGWTPPDSLVQFMDKARQDGAPIVYIGFGSITVPHPNAVTETIVKAVLKSGVRAILSKGWSSRMSQGDEPEPEIPPEIYMLNKVPHDWLFPRIDAALHHGGAGTTGASLRAGIPTLIKPWFGDQYFWASVVTKAGAGLKVGLHVNQLASALQTATTSTLMKERAAAIGQRVRSEDGVTNALKAIYTYLDRAGQDRTSL